MPKRPRAFRRLLLGAALLVAALLLLLSSFPGPDFGHYRAWAQVLASGDLFLLESSTGSPLGVPMSTWSHAPGMFFALGDRVLAAVSPNTAAAAVSWLFSIAALSFSAVVLYRAAGGSYTVAGVGIGVLILGTPAGHYTRAFASESIGLAFVALLAWQTLRRRSPNLRDCLWIGVATAGLLLTRSYTAIYALPALLRVADAVYREYCHRRQLASAFLLGVPVAVAVLQIMLVNRWMTGRLLHSPYAFGNAAFRSLDWTRPELGSVLFSPWHGLLVYHPLFAIAAILLFVEIRRSGSFRERVLLVATTVAVCVNLAFQASWYVWWMGTGTFGMRGMTAASIPVAILVTRQLGRAEGRRVLRVTFVVLLISCCMWSFLLMRLGNSNFYEFASLLAAQRRSLGTVLTAEFLAHALLGAVIVIAALVGAGARTIRPMTGMAILLLALPIAHSLGVVVAVPRPVAEQLVHAALVLTVLVISCGLLISELSPPRLIKAQLPGLTVAAWAMTIAFAAGSSLFLSMAVRAERRIAAGTQPARNYRWQEAFDVNQVIASSGEYRRIAGYEAKKQALAGFLGEVAETEPSR